VTLSIAALVLFAALLHASWNALLKRGGDGFWSMTVMGVATALFCAVAVCFVPLPARMYLRPASMDSFTACSSGTLLRMSISLIRLGRLAPARTSILPFSSRVSARLQGVPPNMSVAMITPPPMSTDLAAAAISRWRRSISSSGPMQTARRWVCGPTICSIAEMNSWARRPWVTRTMPIMNPYLQRRGQ
jgi:hypothetical protein